MRILGLKVSNAVWEERGEQKSLTIIEGYSIGIRVSGSGATYVVDFQVCALAYHYLNWFFFCYTPFGKFN